MMEEVQQSLEAPQADRLDLVRRVVGAISTGVSRTDAIAAEVRIAPRYALYCVHAARLIGLLDESPSNAVAD
jgi:hypothetical protein